MERGLFCFGVVKEVATRRGRIWVRFRWTRGYGRCMYVFVIKFYRVVIRLPNLKDVKVKTP